MTLRQRFASQARLKLWLAVVLNLGFYLPYGWLQRHPWFPVHEAPTTGFDRWLPFWELAVWAYLSLFLLMPIAPLMMHSRSELVRYGFGILAIELIASVVFALIPTFCPRPTSLPTGFVHEWLTKLDQPLNAFPSLHVAFAAFSALCCCRVARELNCGFWLQSAALIWAGLIALAALLTKQHRIADVLAGALLGLAIHSFTFKCINTEPFDDSVDSRLVHTNIHTIRL